MSRPTPRGNLSTSMRVFCMYTTYLGLVHVSRRTVYFHTANGFYENLSVCLFPTSGLSKLSDLWHLKEPEPVCC